MKHFDSKCVLLSPSWQITGTLSVFFCCKHFIMCFLWKVLKLINYMGLFYILPIPGTQNTIFQLIATYWPIFYSTFALGSHCSSLQELIPDLWGRETVDDPKEVRSPSHKEPTVVLIWEGSQQAGTKPGDSHPCSTSGHLRNMSHLKHL